MIVFLQRDVLLFIFELIFCYIGLQVFFFFLIPIDQTMVYLIPKTSFSEKYGRKIIHICTGWRLFFFPPLKGPIHLSFVPLFSTHYNSKYLSALLRLIFLHYGWKDEKLLKTISRRGGTDVKLIFN